MSKVTLNWQAKFFRIFALILARLKRKKSKNIIAERDLPIDTVRTLNRVSKRQIVDIYFLIFGVLGTVWMLYSAYLDFPSREADMFPRSGAVLVALALLAEFGSLQIEDHSDDDSQVKEYLSRSGSTIKKIATFYIVLGTVVWAYGDKLLLEIWDLIEPLV